MTKKIRYVFLGLLLAAGGVTLALSGNSRTAANESPAAQPATTKPGTAQPAAVEADMHEFMEYVFEPPYKRLKAGLAAQSVERSAWKGIKSDTLILAEAANLLLHRHPAERGMEWDENALAVRQQGGTLYEAAKKRDIDGARKQFAAMLSKCNHCHDEFADGEHQLKP